jgi:hypothetical protein
MKGWSGSQGVEPTERVDTVCLLKGQDMGSKQGVNPLETKRNSRWVFWSPREAWSHIRQNAQKVFKVINQNASGVHLYNTERKRSGCRG